MKRRSPADGRRRKRSSDPPAPAKKLGNAPQKCQQDSSEIWEDFEQFCQKRYIYIYKCQQNSEMGGFVLQFCQKIEIDRYIYI